MSSGPMFPSHSASIDPEQLCGDVSAGSVAPDLFYSNHHFNYETFGTPYQPTTAMESGHQPAWSGNQYVRPSAAELSGPQYAVQPHHVQHQTHAPSSHQPSPQQQQTAQAQDYNRPRSSPSTFGPGQDMWLPNGMGNGLGIQNMQMSTAPGQSTTISALPPGMFEIENGGYSTSTRPEIHQPRPHRFTTIAPNPHGPAVKRKRDEDEQHQAPHDTPGAPGAQSKPKRKRTSSVVSADLSEEDRFLVQLKQEENLPWKDIATRFQNEKGRSMQVAALQMRYKRLREKFRTWEEQDVHALKLAHEYWEKYKWEIISSKMLDFNIQERWPARHCSRKWLELDQPNAAHVTPGLPNPGLTPVSMSHQFSSPIETGGQMQFAFKPLQ